MKAQRSTLPNVEEITEKWYHVDAEGQVVGRLAARIAKIVRGKTGPEFTPHLNPKIHVVITNAEKVVFTGKKTEEKTYYWHSGWRTGIKSATAKEMLERKPEEVLRKAIYGMLPKGPLGSKLNKNVRIFAGPEHTHSAQTPESLVIETRNAVKADDK